jgi:hypothetical protein
MSGTTCEYSEAERKLIGAIDPMWLSALDRTNIYPSQLYKILCTTAFLNDMVGPKAEALKRATIAVDDSSPYRMTPEFDKLCEF